METQPPESKLEQQEDFNRKLFLIETKKFDINKKLFDVIKDLIENNQLCLELITELMESKNEKHKS